MILSIVSNMRRRPLLIYIIACWSLLWITNWSGFIELLILKFLGYTPGPHAGPIRGIIFFATLAILMCTIQLYRWATITTAILLLVVSWTWAVSVGFSILSGTPLQEKTLINVPIMIILSITFACYLLRPKFGRQCSEYRRLAAERSSQTEYEKNNKSS